MKRLTTTGGKIGKIRWLKSVGTTASGGRGAKVLVNERMVKGLTIWVMEGQQPVALR